jgi:hypothetical protein
MDVLAGGLLMDGELDLRATIHGSENLVTQIIKIMRYAMFKKNPVELLADKITNYFILVIILLAILTSFMLFLSGLSPDKSMLRGDECACDNMPMPPWNCHARGKSRGNCSGTFKGNNDSQSIRVRKDTRSG